MSSGAEECVAHAVHASKSVAPAPTQEAPGNSQKTKAAAHVCIDSDTESDQTAGLDLSEAEEETCAQESDRATPRAMKHLSMPSDLITDVNSFVECFLAIPSGLERSSDYIRYVYNHGDLQMPTSFVDQIRKRSRKLRRNFEKLETYCLAKGCYVIGHDSKGLDVRKTRQLLSAALAVCQKCAGDFVYMARLISRCATVCHASASIAGEWHRGRRYRELALDERRAYQTYREEMLKPLSDSGEMTQGVFELSDKLCDYLRKSGSNTRALTTLVQQMQTTLRPFHDMFAPARRTRA